MQRSPSYLTGVRRDKPFRPDPCPRCHKPLKPHPEAISRLDNRTEICTACGTDEAMADWLKHNPEGQP